MKKLMITSMLFLSFSMAMASGNDSKPKFPESSELTVAGIDGVWTALIPTKQGPQEVTFTYKVVENKITGFMGSDYGDFEISKGTVEGDTFEYTLDIGNGAMLLKHVGKLTGKDEILISSTNAAGVTTEWSLTRAKE